MSLSSTLQHIDNLSSYIRNNHDITDELLSIKLEAIIHEIRAYQKPSELELQMSDVRAWVDTGENWQIAVLNVLAILVEDKKCNS